MDPDKGGEKIPGGGYVLQSRGCGGGDWGMFGDTKRDTIRYTGGILDTEAVVPTCIGETDTPFCTYLEKVLEDDIALYQR